MKPVPTYQVTIFIAGDPCDIKRTCQKFFEVGLCVSVTPTEFVYTGGRESGAAIGLINYARFPKTSKEIDATGKKLAFELMKILGQRSCSLITPRTTSFLENPTINVSR